MFRSVAVLSGFKDTRPTETDALVLRITITRRVFLTCVQSTRRYLSLGDLKDANIVIEETRKRTDAAAKKVLEASPLIHFIDFLLQT